MTTNITDLIKQGTELFDQDKTEDALKVFESCLQENPNDAQVLGWIARCFARKEDANATVDYSTKALTLDPQCVNALRAMAYAYRLQKKYHEAIECYDQALAIDKSSYFFYSYKALCYQYLQDYSNALICINQAIELDSKDPSFFYRKSDILKSANRFTEAITEISTGINLKPTEAYFYEQRANINIDLCNWKEALKDLNLAIQLEPKRSSSYKLRAWLYVFKFIDFEMALVDANKAIELSPNTSDFYRIRGYVHEKRESHKLAIDDFSKSIDLDPTNSESIISRANLFEKLQNYERSILDNSRYYKLEPKEKLSSTNKNDDKWFKVIHDHFLNLTNQLEGNQESFIDYFACYITWGERNENRSYNGTSSTYRYGFFGTGYLLITDQNVRVFSFGSLSEEFSLYKKRRGLLNAFFNTDYRKIDTQNKTWVIPNQSIAGAQIKDDSIILVTPAMTWTIDSCFSVDLPIICTALNMAMLGKYQDLNEKSINKINNNLQPSDAENKDQIFDSLKKLGELKASGIISEADFEKKKDELLSRL